MADPFYEPLPGYGDVPWNLNGPIQEIRERIWDAYNLISDANDRISDVNDLVSGPGIQEAIAEAAGELYPEALSDTFIATQVEDVDSETTTALKAGYEEKLGARGVTRTVYVRSTGSDSTGDGRTVSSAYRELKYAVSQTLNAFGPVVRGSVVFDLGAGTYKGGIVFPTTRYRSQDDFIRIVGPSVGGHPNVPTAIIDKSADTSATYGIQVVNGTSIRIENVKFVGGFNIGLDVRVNCAVLLQNVHFDGQNTGLVGIGMLTQSIYDMRGGIVENWVDSGLEEHFGITRIFDNVNSTAEATIFRFNGHGLRAKEDCHGHLDYLRFEDNGVGVELQAWTTANFKAATFKRNLVGVALINAEMHNEGGIVWGTGADANSRRVVSLGNSDELKTWGWVNDNTPKTITTGHRPLRSVANSYTDTTLTGSTSEILAYQSPAIIPAGQLSVAGRHVRVTAWFSIVTPPSTDSRILLRLAGNLTAQVVVPSTAISGQDFKVEFDTVCPEDGNNQKTMAVVNGFPAGVSAHASTTHNLSDANFSAAVGVIHSESATSFTLRAVEVYA